KCFVVSEATTTSGTTPAGDAVNEHLPAAAIVKTNEEQASNRQHRVRETSKSHLHQDAPPKVKQKKKLDMHIVPPLPAFAPPNKQNPFKESGLDLKKPLLFIVPR